MDPIVGCFTTVAEKLRDAVTYDDVIKACLAIESLDNKLPLFKKHYENETYLELTPSGKQVTRLLIKHFLATKDLTIQRAIMKSMLKPAICMNYVDVELMLGKYGATVGCQGANCMLNCTWIQNFKFREAFDVTLPTKIQLGRTMRNSSLKYSSEFSTQFFWLAIENVIAAYDVKHYTKFDPEDDDLFEIVLTNLENLHKNVRKLLLELFKRMVACTKNCNDAKDVKKQNCMVKDVLELPWTNRNKYHLLSHLITINCELLLKHPKFKKGSFLKGIQVGLTIHHLMGASQTLVKAFHNKPEFKDSFMQEVAVLLWEGEEKLVKNLINYWFSSFDPPFIAQLYKLMSHDGKFTNISTTSIKFNHLLMLRNAFKKTFKVPELDVRIREFSCIITDLPMKIEILYVLIENVNGELDHRQLLENILTLLKFLRCNLCFKDSNFIEHHIMRKLPDFFNLLASQKLRQVEVLREIFSIIRCDLYQHGIELGSYESVSFSLKLLNVILKQYCGVRGIRLSKNTNVEGNLSFAKYLKEKEIWDLTSSNELLRLIKLIEGSQNSDHNDLATKLLIEYFIKHLNVENIAMANGETFVDWVGKKVEDSLKETELTAALGANPFFKIKFEHLMSKDLAVCELLTMTDLVKTRFMEFKKQADPVRSMQEGLHIYNVMKCINYGLKRLDPSDIDHKLVTVLNVLLKLVAYHFLTFFDGVTSFEILDQKLKDLIEKSSWQEPCDEDLKSKLLLFIWYTLRSTSEITDSLAKNINATMNPSEKDYKQVMTTAIEINVQILSRCCHKGAMESASDALGKITKIISKRFSNLCDRTSASGKNLHGLLVMLKKEIDCGKRAPASGDIRCSRGLVQMSHSIIANHPPFLKFLMDSLLITREICSFYDTQLITFNVNVKPIQLHLLAALIKDGEVLEEMLKYYDFILLATFDAYKRSSDFVMMNALLQVIGAILPKISNQKSHVMDEETATMHYEPKAVTVYEFYVKFTFAFRIGLWDLMTIEKTPLAPTYIIILLEILSNFEYRNAVEHWSEVSGMLEQFQKLLSHDCEKIRLLAGKCYAQYLPIDKKMLKIIQSKIDLLFSEDGNCVLATLNCLRIMIERYESCVKSVCDFDGTAFKSLLRDKITENFNEYRFIGAHNFYIRYHLLDFLIFLGFKLTHKVTQSLFEENGLKSHIGYRLWVQKITHLQTE